MIILIFFLLFATIAGMLGIGGGALFTPMQIFLGSSIDKAATTSLILMTATSISASLVFKKRGLIDLKLVFWLEIFTVAGSFSGGLFSRFLPDQVMEFIMVTFLALLGCLMIFLPEPKRKLRKKGRFCINGKFEDEEYNVSIPLAAPAAFGAGFISAIMGLGGGAIKVPLMVMLLGVPVRIAVASSALMVGITAFGGFMGRIWHVSIDWKMIPLYIIAILVGSNIGARSSLRIDKRVLKKGFGLFLVGVSISLAIRFYIG